MIRTLTIPRAAATALFILAGLVAAPRTASAQNACVNNPCDPNATCTSTGGTYSCTRNYGYQGNGLTCSAINRCLQAPYPCDLNATCTDTGPGTFAAHAGRATAATASRAR